MYGISFLEPLTSSSERVPARTISAHVTPVCWNCYGKPNLCRQLLQQQPIEAMNSRCRVLFQIPSRIRTVMCILARRTTSRGWIWRRLGIMSPGTKCLGQAHLELTRSRTRTRSQQRDRSCCRHRRGRGISAPICSSSCGGRGRSCPERRDPVSAHGYLRAHLTSPTPRTPHIRNVVE